MNTTLDRIEGLDVYWQTSEDMEPVDDESVQAVVTSPPYWDLKDYQHEDQIGTADESYNHYHNRMTRVWSECYDALRPDGTMWIVVDTIMDRGDLTLLPYHIVKRCEDLGFVLQDLVTWYKPTAIAGMTDRNVVNKKEYVVYLSKNKKHTFYNDKDGENGKEDPAVAEKGASTLGNVWRHPVKRGTVGQNVLHKAPYPKSLINRIIRLSTQPEDTVLDPFLGSGTTAYSALNLDRECIGFELNRDFEPVIKDRLQALQQRSITEF